MISARNNLTVHFIPISSGFLKTGIVADTCAALTRKIEKAPGESPSAQILQS
jgi:hypothetical protein